MAILPSVETTIIHKIFETNANFHVKWGNTESINFYFSAIFC